MTSSTQSPINAINGSNPSLEDLVDVVEPMQIYLIEDSYLLLIFGAIILFLVVVLAFILYRFYFKNKNSSLDITTFKYRKKAQSVLKKINKGSEEYSAAYINSILKRVAIISYGNDRVATLFGKEWLEFLDVTMGKNNYFYSNSGVEMMDSAYANNTDIDLSAMIEMSIEWVSNHHKI